MALFFNWGGVDLGTDAVRLGSVTSGFISRAEKGTIGSGGFPVDDADGTRNLVGLKPVYVIESACTSAPRLWTGYAQDRTVTRGQNGPTDSLRTGAARRWDCNLVDLNAIVGFRVFTASTANRPNETIDERIAWLMSTPQMSLVADHGFIGSSSAGLSANDYRGMYPADVLNDIVNVCAFDYHIFYDQDSGDPTLFLDDPTADTRVSTLSISNVLADQSDTCFFPLVDATLVRDPSRVFSGIDLEWNGGTTYDTNDDTAAAFIARDVVVSTSRIGRATTATAQVAQFLAASAAEFDRISCTLKLPAAQVNLIDAGMRVNAKFSHLPGYEDGVDLRVALRQVRMDEQTEAFYNVYLELILPIQTNYQWLGGGMRPDFGPPPPVTAEAPACLTSLGTLSFAPSSDGTYPAQPCTPFAFTISSFLMCADDNVGNWCNVQHGALSGYAVYSGPTIGFAEQKAVGSIPAGAVLARLTAQVADLTPPSVGANRPGWKVNLIAGHAPQGFDDGITVLASEIAGEPVTADFAPNALGDGSLIYALGLPIRHIADKPVCDSVDAAFPGGGYYGIGISVEFFGFCDGATGLSNWVGGVGAVDGMNRTFILTGWDGTGIPQAKVNGLLTAVTPDPATLSVTFASPPAAAPLFNYSVAAGSTAAPSSAPTYGVTTNADTLANTQVGGDGTPGVSMKVAHRFTASRTGTLIGVRWYVAGGSGYSAGTGGTIVVSLQADDAGAPSGTAIASYTHDPMGHGDDGGTPNVLTTFETPGAITEGQVYWIVWENTDPDYDTNFASVDDTLCWDSVDPRTPAFGDDWQVWLWDGSWSERTGFAPIMELHHDNGGREGIGYYQFYPAAQAPINGDNMVRERFTVTGGDRTIQTAHLRLKRDNGTSGTDPLTVTLEAADGTTIDSGTIAATTFPKGTQTDSSANHNAWGTATFASAHTVANGSTYRLRLSSPSGTVFRAPAMSKAGAYGYDPATYFADGHMEVSTDGGSTWADDGGDPTRDLQFYLT